MHRDYGFASKIAWLGFLASLEKSKDSETESSHGGGLWNRGRGESVQIPILEINYQKITVWSVAHINGASQRGIKIPNIFY